MTNIRYVGAETSVETFGKTFAAKAWTDDAGLTAEAVAILSQNPQFVVTETAEPVVKPAKAKAAAPVDVAPADDDAGGAPALQEPAV